MSANDGIYATWREADRAINGGRGRLIHSTWWSPFRLSQTRDFHSDPSKAPNQLNQSEATAW